MFSLHEWDVGLVKGVEHSIILSDTKLYHERSRHIASADVEDVQRHLREPLASGIIRVLESICKIERRMVLRGCVLIRLLRLL